MKDFRLPPRSYAEAETFSTALKHQWDMVGETMTFLRSPQEVADYLNEHNFRPQKPIQCSNVYYWMQRCPFWYSKPLGPQSRRFVTTNLHLFAFLWTFGQYRKPAKLSLVKSDQLENTSIPLV